MQSNYWTEMLETRLRRRRTLAVAGSALAGTALLAACGGGSNGGQEKEASKLLTKPVDTTKQAKRGGTFALTTTMGPTNWEPFQNQQGSSLRNGMLLQRITTKKPGILTEASGDSIGDLVESWEFSPDRLSVTFKIRDNTWHNVAPVNGRKVDAEDVAVNWARFEVSGVTRSTYSNKVDPSSPILSVTAIDPKTVQYKLAYPTVTILGLLALSGGGAYWQTPKEAAVTYDPKVTSIGSGAFQLGSYEPDQRMVFKRHAGYWNKEMPFIDAAEYFLLPVYATALAQFKVGSIYTFGVRPEDLLSTKQDVPDLVMQETGFGGVGTGTYFGYAPTPGAVFRDERLRQAYSMAMDRDLLIDVFRNVKGLRDNGLDVKTRWHSALDSINYLGMWLDPQGKDFGPNAKYYEHNVTEAKKLVSAAGYNGQEVLSTSTSAGEGFGNEQYVKYVEVLEQMTSEAGFLWKKNIVDYQTVFIPRYYTAQGKFEGVAYANLNPSDAGDPIEGINVHYSKSSTLRGVGLDANGRGDQSGDPNIENAIAKGRLEPDFNKRKEILYDLQKYLAPKMYLVRGAGASSNFSLYWPVMRNFGVYDDGGHLPNYYTWLDETLPPLKKA